MGHERVGNLPKTHRWHELVRRIADFEPLASDASEIAEQTLRNVHSRYRRIPQDEGVRAAFVFLVNLAVASRSANPQGGLRAMGIELPANPTPLSIARAIHEWVQARRESAEYAQIAQGAAVDAVGGWYDQHKGAQQSLFEPSDAAFETWRKAGNGSGFCELARLFFANMTTRYLSYFLDREASSALGNLAKREKFQDQLRNHVDEVSRHAFETAKITQSFAAGWFNRYAREDVPSESEVDHFLSLAFGKIREELLREGAKHE